MMTIISILMLKLCDKSICKPLNICLQILLDAKEFSHQNGKKHMSYQFIKKKDKECVKNYRPVSLLLICSKVLGRIICNAMFTYFIENNLISESHSGFKLPLFMKYFPALMTIRKGLFLIDILENRDPGPRLP